MRQQDRTILVTLGTIPKIHCKAALDHRSSRLLRRCHSARRQLLQQLRHRPAVPEENSGGMFLCGRSRNGRLAPEPERTAPGFLRRTGNANDGPGKEPEILHRKQSLVGTCCLRGRRAHRGSVFGACQRVNRTRVQSFAAPSIDSHGSEPNRYSKSASLPNNQLRLNVFSSLHVLSIISRANALRESPSPSAFATSSRSGRANRSLASGRMRSRPRSRTIAPR